MKRLLTPLALVLCAGAIVFGAFLPRLFSSWQDSRRADQVHYAPVSDISLDFSGQQSMTLRDKLSFLTMYTDGLVLPGSMTNLSAGDIERIVQETVGTYQKSGLFPTGLKKITSQDFTAQAMLLRAPGTVITASCIVWTVRIHQVDSLYRYSMDLTIDDETGTVLTLSFLDTHTLGSDQRPELPGGEKKLEAFFFPYIRSLGEEFSEYDREDFVSENFTQTNNQHYTLRLQWSDLIYGSVTVYFLVSPGEFFVMAY